MLTRQENEYRTETRETGTRREKNGGLIGSITLLAVFSIFAIVFYIWSGNWTPSGRAPVASTTASGTAAFEPNASSQIQHGGRAERFRRLDSNVPLSTSASPAYKSDPRATPAPDNNPYKNPAPSSQPLTNDPNSDGSSGDYNSQHGANGNP